MGGERQAGMRDPAGCSHRHRSLHVLPATTTSASISPSSISDMLRSDACPGGCQALESGAGYAVDF